MAGCNSYRAPPLKHAEMSLERIDKFISQTYYSDINLQSRLLSKTIHPTELLHYAASGRFEFDIAKDAEYSPAKIGDTFGPLWSTHWFRIKFKLPEGFTSSLSGDEEVLLYWDTSSEATIWDEAAGSPIGAFSCAEPHGDVREYYPVSTQMMSSDCVEFMLEVTCNKLVGEGAGSLIAPPDVNATYPLKKCQLSVRNKKVYSLLADLRILADIAKELKDKERGLVALYTANHMVNILQTQAVDSYDRAMKLSTEYLSQGNGYGQHTIQAVGHCHMDCAWLWPYEETKRKCARSWSATLDLMDRYPQWTFACSSAQQYEWVQLHYPKLFNRIKEQVKAGRFIPVGGSWVEMDGYLPSGESMCRQLLFGQRYFLREFGLQCTEFWLPDTFGYSGQLPQIMTHFGMKRFFTQKISWNLFNKFPHHTFYWKGLDGTAVLSHFAPGNCYHMRVTVSEMVKTVDNFEDKGRSNRSMFLFGHGDGGQGPTQDMLENVERLKDVHGLPKIELSTPDKFFAGVEEKESQNLCTWSGELYLEMHNGTYTSQSKIKWYNRRCESLLHNLEFLSSVAYVNDLSPYPFDILDTLWKKVLLNQFHDVLPGSSIEMTNDGAKELYADVMKEGKSLEDKLLGLISPNKSEEMLTLCNTLSWPRTELASVSKASAPGDVTQTDADGNVYQLLQIGALAISQPKPVSFSPVSVQRLTRDGSAVIVMENSKVYAEIDSLGRLTQLRTVKEPADRSRNLLSGLANQFTLYNDMPLYWDAWDVMDYHQETRQPLKECVAVAEVVEEGPLRVSVQVSIKISDSSSMKQTLVLDAESACIRVDCQVDWHENRKFLKVEFPLSVLSDHVTYESQFGHITRPTHKNTSWDSAKYEVCCQRWMDLSDYSSGVSILNDSKYGCSVTHHSTLCLSLLRAPKSPDANADMGVHHFTYAIMPHNGSLQEAGVQRLAHNLNTPVILTYNSPAVDLQQLCSSDQPSVVIDTVKAAECDREEVSAEKSIILRCYESYGGSCQVNISMPSLSVKRVALCDGLENELELLPLDGSTRTCTTAFTPFQVKTLKVVLD